MRYHFTCFGNKNATKAVGSAFPMVVGLTKTIEQEV